MAAEAELEPLPEAASLWRLDPSMLHCNHGSFGATPRPVLDLQQHLRAEADADRDHWFRDRLLGLQERARDAAAAFCGASPDTFAFVHNVSEATTAVLRSHPWSDGDELLLTDHGYGAVALAAAEVASRHGVTVRVAHVPLTDDPEEISAAVLAAVTPRTRVAVIDGITSPTALPLPLERLVPALQHREVVVHVDGAHTPGHIPLDLARLGPDSWTGNFHKWGFAPLGSAGFFVATRHQSRLRPPTISNDDALGFPRSFLLQATQDYTPWLSVPAALECHSQLGGPALTARNQRLATAAQAVVAGALGTTPPTAASCAMALVPLPGGLVRTHEEAGALMTRISREAKAWVAVTCWDGQGWLRLSAQAYNGIRDYEELGARVRRVLG